MFFFPKITMIKYCFVILDKRKFYVQLLEFQLTLDDEICKSLNKVQKFLSVLEVIVCLWQQLHFEISQKNVCPRQQLIFKAKYPIQRTTWHESDMQCIIKYDCIKTETSQVFKLKIKIKHKSDDKMITGNELHLSQFYMYMYFCNGMITVRPRVKTNK